MATITLKNIPDELHEALKQKASIQRRSLNNEIIACLEASVRSTPIDADAFLSRIRLLRNEVAGRLTNKDLKTLKNEGRA